MDGQHRAASSRSSSSLKDSSAAVEDGRKKSTSSLHGKPSEGGQVATSAVAVRHGHDAETVSGRGSSVDDSDADDDRELAARMGHKSEFAREFKSLSTISFAFSIMGLISSVATTFNAPFLSGGPATTIWAWFMGACFNMTLGSAIGELCSAYPSAGGLYSASGLVVPRQWRAFTAWVTFWLNGTGQIAGIAGTAWGLAQMVWAYAYVANGYTLPGSPAQVNGGVVGMYIAIMIIHGVITSLPNKWLAKFTSAYVFVNLGATLVSSIVVLARTPREEMLSGSEAFGTITDNTGWNSMAFAFLVGLQSVQFVMTDYDATAHMSEDIKKAAYAAPVAIFVAVLGTGLAGFFLNICFVFASAGTADVPVAEMPGQLAFAQILLNRAGRVGFLIIWPFIMAVAWFVISTALQANARSFYAFSRDRGLPDGKFFARINKRTGQTVNAVWLVVGLCILLIFLSFASTVAVTAIFSLAAIGMDLSYLVPIVLRQIYQDHPDVQFKPGPFYLGRGLLSKAVNYTAIVWTLFECIVLAIPTVMPYDALTFNYSWVITFGVLLLAIIWYFIYAHRHYKGPLSSLNTEQLQKLGVVSRTEEMEADAKEQL